MPAVARKGDPDTGHGCFPPRSSTGGSNNVFINGVGAHREGDAWAVHTCGNSAHASSLAAGSSSVFVNGKALARIGDPVACGSAVAVGSADVFAGG